MSSPTPEQPEDEVAFMLSYHVPAGVLIGMRGETITRVRAETGAIIHVDEARKMVLYKGKRKNAYEAAAMMKEIEDNALAREAHQRAAPSGRRDERDERDRRDDRDRDRERDRDRDSGRRSSGRAQRYEENYD
eukprot:TRINITY_DN3003_c0_g1_i1.p1 TRINITY_DN3003_c0_g1~~TRINITY_DN3003_c0_g1_i1.p1  ORF type:complete len:133 (+),score=18.21 TRINITY_DN3003_c0_g1_i1:96-494(+)